MPYLKSKINKTWKKKQMKRTEKSKGKWRNMTLFGSKSGHSINDI